MHCYSKANQWHSGHAGSPRQKKKYAQIEKEMLGLKQIQLSTSADPTLQVLLETVLTGWPMNKSDITMLRTAQAL